MVQIKATVKLRRRGNLANHIARLTKGLEGPTKVKVGLPRGASPAGVIQIAIWQHFGTAGSQTNFISNGVGGFGGPIPARPFITVAMWRHRNEIRRNLRRIAEAVVQRGTPLSAELPRLGLYGAGLIQGQIQSNMGPPNSALTVRIKGSSRTLIDEGRMVQSVTWTLAEGSGAR